MFKDRDLGILGAGALLAVIALILPYAFAWKIAIGMGVLIMFMVIALLRLGPDRVPLETWLRRRFKYWRSTRRYVYHREGSELPPVEPVSVDEPEPAKTSGSLLPVGLGWDEVGIYPLMTAFLAVVGVYFVVWIANGGGEELARIFR
ncbi:MAG: hypothetical protein U9Q82_06320 [Chloroflexota bacterium]|nr:hypothetical protein [Chloroflexota bacterium]